MEQGGGSRRGDRNGVLIGGVLVAIGAWLLLREFLQDTPLWGYWVWARSHSWPVLLILGGVALIIMGTRSERPHMPAKGTRLYRSRSDKWVSGVFGGIGRYLSIDPLVLRIAFLALAVADFGQALVLYIIAAILVPEEPLMSPADTMPEP